MRKVLAITMALMLAAVILSPAWGYTIQTAGNPTNTAQSGNRVNYSISTGTPAHELAANQTQKMSITPAVQATKVAYSFKAEKAVPYSMKLIGVKGAPEGVQTMKAPAAVTPEVIPATPAVNATPVTEAAKANVTAPKNITVTVPQITAPKNAMPLFPAGVVQGVTVPKNVTAPKNVTENVTAPKNVTAPENLTMPVNMTSPSK